MNDPIVRAVNLWKVLGDHPVLRGVSLQVRAGTALAVMGPNGAGKSTLLEVLSGIRGYDEGELYRFGAPVARHGAPDSRIGYLGHRSFLYPSLTLRENLRFYGKLYRLSDISRRIERWCAEVGLSWWLDEAVKTYSQGMIQRAALVRVMMLEPALMLLDEPFTAIDSDTKIRLSRLIMAQIERGSALLVVTHHLQEASRLVDEVMLLDRGRLGPWSFTSKLSGPQDA